MDIFKLYRFFWDFCFNNPEKIKPTHIAIYSFAVEHCNRLGWKEKFGFPTSMVMEATGIKSYSVYKKHFDDLSDFGLIDVIEFSKNQFSSNVIALKENDKANSKANIKSLDKALTKHSSKQVQSTSESTIQSIDQSTVSIIKQETNIQTNNITKNDIIFNELIVSEMWLENTAMQSSKKFTPDQVKEFLKKYNDMINVQFEFKNNKTEYCTHFVYWLNKQEKESITVIKKDTRKRFDQ